MPDESSSTGLMVSGVKTRMHGHWQPFDQWHSDKLTPITSAHGTQSHWLKTNGMAFRFLGPPKVLQLHKYETVLGPYAWPHCIGTHDHTRLFDPRSRNQFHLDPQGNRPLSPSAL